MKQKIEQLFLLQDKFNKEVNPNWKIANYDWRTAILVESSELIESVGYKWWKKTTPDIDNAKVEVVDILHFIMSELMVKTDLNKAVDILNQSISMYDFSLMSLDSKMISTSIRNMIGNFQYHQLEKACEWFSFVMSLLFDSFDEVFNLYMIKNILNKFRQDHGYKTGEYRKHWEYNGEIVEDNKVAESILKSGITSFDEVYSALEKVYFQFQ